jgi:hypothetical protein
MTSRPPGESRGDTKRHLAVTQVGPAQVGSLERHPRDGWQIAHPYPLGPRALRVLKLLIDALCPSGSAPRSAELDERVLLGARRFLAYMHPTVSRGLAFGLVLLDFLPVLMLAASRTLHRLSPADASRLFARWTRSRFTALRLLVTGLRSLVLSVYFDQDEVHRAMRYAPVPFIKDRIRLRSELLRPLLPIAAE